MKIGYFVGHFPYTNLLNNPDKYQYIKRYNHDGGVAAAYNLTINMEKRGHEIKVFTTSITSVDSVEKHENIKVYRYGTNLKFETVNVSFNLLKKPLKYEVDIAHVHSVNPIAELAALKYAKSKGIPVIVTYHGDPQESFGGLARRVAVNFYIKFLLNKILSDANIIISPSKYFLGNSRFLNKYKDKIVIIPNGVNISDFSVPYAKEECKRIVRLEGNIILFVGRLDQRKGPEVLIKAFVKVVKHIPNAKLVFVGAGPLKAKLDNLSKSLSVNNRVKFAGFIKDYEKPLYYKSADIFVLPSIMNSEIFGIVNLEAMASGTPIIASNIGGIPDVVEDGKEGLLFPPNDPKALAKAIIRLLTDQELRDKISEQASKKVKNFSWEKIAEKTEKIYKQVL